MQQRRELNAEHPLNVIACANLLDNSRVLRDYVYGDLSALDSRYARRAAGFPVCVVDRIIPGAPVTRPGEDPLAVVVGQAFEFVVGSDAVVGPPPPVRGMVLSDRIHAHSEGKLFTLNTAHAIAAYLGYQRGHAYIHDAIRDHGTRRTVTGALEQSSAMLLRRHGFDPNDQARYAAGVLERFGIAGLPDPIERVAREPIRNSRPPTASSGRYCWRSNTGSGPST